MGGDGPPRGGTRGGRDQFDWEKVKSDKDRENYLGHSVKALAGRWQKNKDVYWYTRDKESGGNGGGGGGGFGSVADEIAAIKAAEERTMAEALGMAPKTDRVTRLEMSEYEKSEFLKRGQTATHRRDDDLESNRVKGLGNTVNATLRGGTAREVLAGEGVGDDGGERADFPNAQRHHQREPAARADAAAAGKRRGDEDEDTRETKRRKKKEAKKAAKKAAKHARKHDTHKKPSAHSSSSSS